MSATSCALPKGKLFLGKILHVQHVDKNRATTTEISDLELILNVLKDVRYRRDEEEIKEESKRDGDRDKYASPGKSAKFKVLKQSFGNQIFDIGVYSKPLPIVPDVFIAFHAFAVFRTNQIPESESAAMWWSFEKNGKYVILQQSPNKADVVESVFDVNEEKIGARLLPVKELTAAQGKYMSLEALLESILFSSQLSTAYHVWSANCQKFASYVFQTANGEREKWKTLTCGSLPDEKETLFGAGVNAIRYDSIAKQDKLIPYYQAILEKEGLPEFKRILSNYAGEFINQVDCHGYTLLDWARAFSRDDLENHLIEHKGAVHHQPTDSKSSRQNIFHIAMQYLDSKKDDAKLCFDGIDLAGVNLIGDSALHLALYGGKWKIAMDILKKMKKLSIPVDRANRKGET